MEETEIGSERAQVPATEVHSGTGAPRSADEAKPLAYEAASTRATASGPIPGTPNQLRSSPETMSLLRQPNHSTVTILPVPTAAQERGPNGSALGLLSSAEWSAADDGALDWKYFGPAIPARQVAIRRMFHQGGGDSCVSGSAGHSTAACRADSLRGAGRGTVVADQDDTPPATQRRPGVAILVGLLLA